MSSTSGYGVGTILSLAKDQVVILGDATVQQDRVLNALQVREILIADCMAAMRFCLECDKGYHKAAFQIARALAAQGRKEDAVQQLQGLFSGRSKFCISIWEIRGGSEAKVLPLSSIPAVQSSVGDVSKIAAADCPAWL